MIKRSPSTPAKPLHLAKISLNRESLRRLDADALDKAWGGGTGARTCSVPAPGC